MALKQIMLMRKIEQRKETLAALEERGTALKARSTELESAINEAGTDEEMAAVEEEIGKLENEEKELADEKAGIGKEIAELENDLEELKAKDPTAGLRGSEKNDGSSQNKERTEIGQMSIRTKIFAGMDRREVEAYISREDTKEFLDRVREMGNRRSVSGAELTIPDVTLDLLRDNLYGFSKLAAVVNLRAVAGKARQPIAGAIPEAVWTEAIGILNELDIVFNLIDMDGYKVGGFIPVPNPVLEDSDIGLAGYILDSVGQAVGLALDKAILYGTGVKMPTGIATRLAQSAQPDNWGKDAPAWTDLRTSNILTLNILNASDMKGFWQPLLNALGAARKNYTIGGTFWAMNRKTRMALLGNALAINSAGAVVAGMQNSMPVEGGNIAELPFIPDNNIIGGYGSLYLLAERAGSNLAVSEHVRFIQDQTVFRGTARYDGMPVFGESFVLISLSNTAPYASVNFAPDTAGPALKALAIGNLTLSPAFNAETTDYTAATTNATNTVTATPAGAGRNAEIKVNGTAIENGAAATWNAGNNSLIVTVSDSGISKTYAVTVTKS